MPGDEDTAAGEEDADHLEDKEALLQAQYHYITSQTQIMRRLARLQHAKPCI